MLFSENEYFTKSQRLFWKTHRWQITWSSWYWQIKFKSFAFVLKQVRQMSFKSKSITGKKSKIFFLSFDNDLICFLRFHRFYSLRMTSLHYIHYKKLFTSIINTLNCDNAFFFKINSEDIIHKRKNSVMSSCK